MEQHQNITRHLFMTGRVQGVGYRHWTVGQAHKRNIHGWVRNLHDGRVEAILHGPEEAVDDMTTACYKGPTFAKVTDIAATAGEYNGPDSFEEKPTA